MLIKTITCHDVYNAGASLQAYALAEYLIGLGHEVEVIDYKPRYLSNHYPLWGVANPKYDKGIWRILYNVLKFPGRLKARYGTRKNNFDKFTKKYIPRTKIQYKTCRELENNPPKADVIFAGSDQIWNCLFENGRDPSFYLQFVDISTIRATYAASFAMEHIPEQYRKQVFNWISSLDFISVREKTGVSILQELGIYRGESVVDPVFLLDKQSWNKLICHYDLNHALKDDYVFVYDFDGSESIRSIASEIAKKFGYKVYSFFSNPYSDKCFVKAGPIEFLQLIKNAKVVISNSFHATAFSIIFNKEFYVVNRVEKINTRMMDLLEAVGLEHRYISSENTVNYKETIDYIKVSTDIKIKIEQSKNYINNVLTKGENNEKKNPYYD